MLSSYLYDKFVSSLGWCSVLVSTTVLSDLSQFSSVIILMASSSKALEQVCASLTLTEEEEVGLIVGNADVKEQDEDYRLTLVGKLASNKPFRFNVMRDTLASIWRPGRGMKATELVTNLFIFQFFHEVDFKRVIEDGPWAFEQCLLVLKRLEQKTSPFDVPLNTAEFWVQAHNLPIGFFTERVAQAIGESIGKFICADKKNFEGSWKSFMRVRVLLDIMKPLRRKKKMKKEGGDWFWVEFKYERLPNFCFLCGIIGHTEKFCHLLFEGVNEEYEIPYGSWLRASGR